MMKCLSSWHDHPFPDRGCRAFLSSGGTLGWCPSLICRVWRRVRSWFRCPRPSRWRGISGRGSTGRLARGPGARDGLVPVRATNHRRGGDPGGGCRGVRGRLECRFAGTQWFGEDVLWLAPEPSAPFLALTAAVHATFPHYPPFGGAFAEVIRT
jgi:hypothetical protein